jgi:dihydrofolate reductase
MEDMLRKVIYAMNVSLDGFIEGPNGEADWGVPDLELHQHFNDLESETGVHLYGRRLYETMSYWQTADANPDISPVEREYARLWQQVPTIVFSTTLERVEANARLVKGDIAAEVARLKAQPGKDMALGGAGIGATFMKLNLIDEYHLYVHPIILGGGKPFFAALDKPLKLQLVETRIFTAGVVLLRYQTIEMSGMHDSHS